jgi:hypothetical protein
MRRRFQAENGTTQNSTDVNSTMPFPPPLPVAGENGTGGEFPQPPQEMQQPMPYPYMPQPMKHVDENGTITLHYAPQPMYPYGMYHPMMPPPPQGENDSAAAYPQYHYPQAPYPYAYAPHANPFMRRKMQPQPEIGAVQVAGPMLHVEQPEVMVDPPQVEQKGEKVQEQTTLFYTDETTNPEGDAEVTPKTGVVYAKDVITTSTESVMMEAMKPVG